jgi:hypothetical protein
VGSELLLLYGGSGVSNADYLLGYSYLPLYGQRQHLTGVKLTQEVVQNTHNYADLRLHAFALHLLDALHPEEGGDGALRAAKWRHVVHTERVPAVLRVTRGMLMTAQPQVLPVASQICRSVPVGLSACHHSYLPPCLLALVVPVYPTLPVAQ